MLALQPQSLDRSLPLWIDELVVFPSAYYSRAIPAGELLEAIASRMAVFCLCDGKGVGCVADIVRIDRNATGATLVVRGSVRARLRETRGNEPYRGGANLHGGMVFVSVVDDVRDDDENTRACAATARALTLEIVRATPALSEDAQSIFERTQDAGALADLIATNLDAPSDVKADLLGTVEVTQRLYLLIPLLAGTIEALEMREKISRAVRSELEAKIADFHERPPPSVLRAMVEERERAHISKALEDEARDGERPILEPLVAAPTPEQIAQMRKAKRRTVLEMALHARVFKT